MALRCPSAAAARMHFAGSYTQESWPKIPASVPLNAHCGGEKQRTADEMLSEPESKLVKSLE